MINDLPASYLLPPRSGELFDSLDACNRRMRGYALAEGFDIVRQGGGTSANPSYRFKYIHHGVETRNHRKLEDHIGRDSAGKIMNKRKKEGRPVQGLGYPWSALCSFKIIAKDSEDKGFVLTMQVEAHVSHPLVNDPFVYTAHLKASQEYQEVLRQAVKHRSQVLPYSTSRRLIDAEDLGVILSSRDYYNSVRKEMPDKAKPETIVALLRMLEDQQFVYQTRSQEIIDEVTGELTARKLVQLFFAHREQLVAAQRFVSDWLIVIDGTFNTNKLSLPLLVCVGVLSTNETFPVAFSYCQSESKAPASSIRARIRKGGLR